MNDLSERLSKLSPAKRRLLEQRLNQRPELAVPIAIVGMACRFPSAPNLDAYWRLIYEGVDGTGEIPESRWDVDALYDPSGEQSGKMSTRWAGLVDKHDQFDPFFFGISPREAAKIDPQQRFLMEVAWEALEHGGLAPDQLRGTATGVFVGIGGTDYAKVPMQYEDYYDHIDGHSGTGNALSIAANRLSYVFDFQGPSFAIDTACSSGLAGVHLAIQSLRSHECDTALAGGVNMILSPETTIAFSQAKMLSRDGRCRPFDAAANGYVRGEGCAVVVLKRLTDAHRDGDSVLAVLRASATNQDGCTSGITAPNGISQQKVIRAALDQAGLSPARVTYVEAHGTGTPLGDPIEIEALGQVFRQRGENDQPCHVTSVKANIGHLETVSGVAGLIKVALMMKHAKIPAQLHFRNLNPHISLAGTRLRIPTEPIDWKPEKQPHIAGVSSFGFGGTNVHLIVEQATNCEIRPPSTDRGAHVLTLSAKTESALRQVVGNYLEHVEAHPDQSVADIAYSANTGRSHFAHRMAVVADSRARLVDQLTAMADGRRARGTKTAHVKNVKRPRVAMVFTGQGSQYVGMGRQLYETQPAFRRAIQQCDEILADVLDQRLVSILYAATDDASPLHETAFTQPALFALEYAVASLWRSWGVEPSVVMGHSVGEYAAACIAGVFDLEDGLRLIAERARLMQQLPRDGLMAVVFAPQTSVQDQLRTDDTEVAIAAVNGPRNTVISGKAGAVRAYVADFEAAGIKSQVLNVSHAFHSPLLEPMLDEFEQVADQLTYRQPCLPIVSNLTGNIHDQAMDARYWREHARNAVLFAQGMETLADQESRAVLEVGPAATLLSMGRNCVKDLDVAWLPSLRKGQDDWSVMVNSLAELYLLGAPIDWHGFDADWPRRRIVLPSYPFERTRYWYKESRRRDMSASARGPAVHPLLGTLVSTAIEPQYFEVCLNGRDPSYLADHQVQGTPVFPAAAYLEQALVTSQRIFGAGSHCVEDVSIQQALFLPAGTDRVVQVTPAAETDGMCTLAIHSAPRDEANRNWTMHASATLRRVGTGPADPEPPSIDIDEVRQAATDYCSREEFYAEIAKSGLQYGPAFQALGSLARSGQQVLADVRLPDDVVQQMKQYHLHPVLLDACLQSMAALVPLESDGEPNRRTYLPTGLRRVAQLRPLTEGMYVYATRRSSVDETDAGLLECDVFLLDEQGKILVELVGVSAQRLGGSESRGEAMTARDWLYQVCWQPQPRTPGDSPSRMTPPGTWIVFADRLGTGDSLHKGLQQAGQTSVVVLPGSDYQKTVGPDGSITIEFNPLRQEDYRRLFADAFAEENPAPAGVIHLWSLDTPQFDEAGCSAVTEAREKGCGSVLLMIQELARFDFRTRKPSPLWLVTQGAQRVNDDQQSVAVGQSPLWGMGRVAAIELPELRCRLIDLDPDHDSAHGAAALLADLVDDPDEDQIAYRGADRWVARLRRASDLTGDDDTGDKHTLTLPDSPYRLRLGTPGSFDSLQFEPLSRQQPGPGQLEIEVHASALNFSDVLKTMGLYPGIRDKTVPLGIECSGTVTRVGEGVRRFRVGDEVMGVAPYSFASHAITTADAVVPKPANIDHQQASTIPITFLTAFYALRRLADLQPGERILIHAGAGGVGTAAIQIAQHIGAEVFATAGSDEKRDYLRACSVAHAMDSRTLDFASQIMDITAGEGVDVVLNSLPGEAITKSLSILRAYGRFLEIGKTDIYRNQMIGLRPFQNNLSYFAIDLDRMLRQRPAFIRDLFAELMEYFEAGAYQPLTATTFAMDDIVGAFRYMAQRRNIGKVVISHDRTSMPATSGTIHSDATYLITGGLGALGLRVAEGLVARGANHLALLSRRPPAEPALAAIDGWREAGVEVITCQADVADLAALDDALAQVRPKLPPLRGVVHAAGVLDDVLLYDMDLRQLEQAMAPKVDGAWNLHTATLDAPLDFFVMFSSIACLLGSPGQGNYAAGNAFLDGLAQYRNASGLPATSISWGPWAEAGMAAAAKRSANVTARGLGLIPPTSALNVLMELLNDHPVTVAVMDADWDAIVCQLPQRKPSLLRDVVAEMARDSSAAVINGADTRFRHELIKADGATRKSLLSTYFADELAHIMGIDAADLDVDESLQSFGLDSLMAMELKNKLESRLQLDLPVSQFLSGPSVRTLAGYAADLFASTSDGTESATDTPTESDTWTPLLQFHSSGTGAPLFCIHPVGGDVRCYVDLARSLQGVRPVYALRARGIETSLPPETSVADIADNYLRAIHDVVPEGTYCLVGWSTGGIFASEMARKVIAQGRKLMGLFLLDSPTPEIFQNVDLNDDARFLFDVVNFSNWFADAQMTVSYEQLRGQDADQRLQTVLNEAKQYNVVAPQATTDHIRRLIDVCRKHVRAIREYIPQPLKQTVHLIRPAETSVLAKASGQDVAEDLGWGNLLGDRLQLHETPGDHFSMMKGDHATQLAASLNRLIDLVAPEAAGRPAIIPQVSVSRSPDGLPRDDTSLK